MLRELRTAPGNGFFPPRLPPPGLGAVLSSLGLPALLAHVQSQCRDYIEPWEVQTFLSPQERASLGLGAVPGSLAWVPPRVKVQGIPQAISAPAPDASTFRIVRVPTGSRGTMATLEIMGELAREAAGDPYFVEEERSVVADCPSKDYACEAQKILTWTKDVTTYREDSAGVLNWVQSPGYTLYIAPGGAGACFVKGTRVLLRAGMKIVPIESVRVGDEIWGRDRWSLVQNTWERGTRRTSLIKLNNGSSIRLTPDHKVYVARCQHWKSGSVKARMCSCPISERLCERIDVRELKTHDCVISPERVAFGTEGQNPLRTWVEGAYLADGWVKNSSSFAVSGKSGGPREGQKLEIAEACRQLGISTYMHARYVTVKDSEWLSRCHAMGTVAWEKHALSIDLTEPAARNIVRGILSDSGRNTNGAGRTFTTSSRELWLQTRVLLKMFGVSCSDRFVPDHGGASKLPVWRLGLRSCPALDALGMIYDKTNEKPRESATPGRKVKLLRVEDVLADNAEVACFDVATDDHYVWLPEADWTVSNCDDLTTLIGGLDIANGKRVMFRAVALDPGMPDAYSHVYPLVYVSGVWLAQDAVGPGALGWEPPVAEWLLPPMDLEI